MSTQFFASRRRPCPSLPLARLAQIFALALTGCASLGAPLGQMRGLQAYPAWVRAGSIAQGSGAQRELVGVGEVRGIRNVALSRSTADNRARAELARVLDAYVDAWVSQVALPGGPPQAPLARALAAAMLPAAQIVAHDYRADDGAVYALARLRLADAQAAIDGLREVDAPLLDALAQASAAAHDLMVTQAARRARAR